MFVPIKKNIFELIEMKSKFISIVFPLNNISDFDKIIDEIKNTYPDASHYLYAYSFDNKMKFDNNGEPGNIAKRILDLFSLMKINNVLVVVVRYFGGIKLGAANLLRTYVKAANESLKQTKLGKLEEMYLYKINCDYPTFNKIKRAGYKIEDVKYGDKINIEIISKNDIINNLNDFKDIEIECERIKKVCQI